eukprot:Phypoly_transcript_15627.p1 GENE.Phypoly_transcript_15627~~Phypoly_transcript_15627.p1  ORF type:complete len:160 (+),score=31.51 Phypoly_transcript_15627:143-622(+)
MEEPQPPEPGECCGSGCSPCVWDLYYDKLEKYENWKAEQEKTKEKDAEVIGNNTNTNSQADNTTQEGNTKTNLTEGKVNDEITKELEPTTQANPTVLDNNYPLKESTNAEPLHNIKHDKNTNENSNDILKKWPLRMGVLVPCCVVGLALGVGVYLQIKR